MSPPNPDRGAHATPHRRGARALHIQARKPRVRPVATLEAIQYRILAALATGPKTLGELCQYYFHDLKAALRDEAVAGLLKAGRVRLVSIPHRQDRQGCLRREMKGIELAEGVRRA